MRMLREVSSKISSRFDRLLNVQVRRYVHGKCTPQSGPQSFTLSETRLEEFVQAELGYFAQMDQKPVRLGQIIDASTPEQVAHLIHKTLAVGYAMRVKNLENLPHFTDIYELLETRKILAESFRNLRLVQESNLEHLEEVLIDMRKRHTPIPNLLSLGVQKLTDLDHMTQPEANDWLNGFLAARVGTEMLTQHFLTMHREAVERCMNVLDREEAGRRGIVDRRCDPGKIALRAADNVKKIVKSQGETVEIEVQTHDCSASRERIEFSFVPQYLQYMLEELLKNSAMAVINKRAMGGMDPSLEMIRIIIAADPSQVRIQISDRAGGIPSANQQKVWSYSWSTKEFEPGRVKETEASPLAGLGMGLPLTRLYAEYLGGSLQLMSLPGRGADVFLDLMRIDPKAAVRKRAAGFDDAALDNRAGSLGGL